MRNLTLLTDFYELTMANGYFSLGVHKRKAVFDVFFRQNEVNNLAIAAGLEQAIDYIKNLNFTDEDIEYLREQRAFSEDFLTALKDFRFTGDVYSVEEGTVVFPGEPILTVCAPIWEAQIVETALLTIINHQTLIATKACKVKHAAENDVVMEFGLRRAQGPDAGIYGSRAAIIGGCDSTSNVLAAKMFGLSPKGTHSHSWVMSFPDELTAFRRYAELFPSNCMLLVDTYDTLKSGVPNAIKVFDEMKAKGLKPLGIRLDSGDLSYLSKKARLMLDAAGHSDCGICASSDLDEDVIQSLKMQGAKINSWGVGTRLITSADMPALGGVYKLSAIEEDGKLVPKIKVSDNAVKITNPGFKTVYRIYDKSSHKALADLIALKDEKIAEDNLTIFHPIETWKQMTLTNYELKELHVQIFKDGELVYKEPRFSEIVAKERREIASFWEEYRRVSNPQIYKVDLSQELYDLKTAMLRQVGK